MRKALALVAVAALTVGVAGTSTAAVKKKPPKKLPASHPAVVVDQAGDANGINGQGSTNAVPAQATPQGQRSAADITGVTVDRLDDTKAVLGLHVTMKLSAAPDKMTVYRVKATTADCTTFFIEYAVDAQGATGAQVRTTCGGASKTFPLATGVTVKDTTIDWQIAWVNLPTNFKVGYEMTAISGGTRGLIGTIGTQLVTAPQFDETDAIASYKVGQ